MHNLKQLAIAIDQLLNVLISCVLREQAWADMTLSAQAYRWEKYNIRSYPRKIIDFIFFWEIEHCKQSYESEIDRLQSPPETRQII